MQENTQEKKRTKVELVEAMQRLYVEISSLLEQVDEIKNEAKERQMPHALMAKIAKLRAESKIDDVLDRNEEFAELVEEIRSN